jgi:hypothetical protein
MKSKNDILSEVISEMTDRISKSLEKGDHQLDEKSISMCRDDAREILGYLEDLKKIKLTTHQLQQNRRKYRK